MIGRLASRRQQGTSHDFEEFADGLDGLAGEERSQRRDDGGEQVGRGDCLVITSRESWNSEGWERCRNQSAKK